MVLLKITVIVACCVLIFGCSENDRQQVTREQTSESSEVTVASGQQQAPVPVTIEVAGIGAKVFLVNRREVRIFLDKTASPQNPNLSTSGTLQLAGMETPLSIYGSMPHADYVYARSREEIVPPVEAMLTAEIGSEHKGKTKFTIPENAAMELASDKEPSITSAGLNVRYGDDTALLAVFGKNFANAALFLRSSEEEIPLPYDVNTDTEIVVLDPNMEGTIRSGQWDVAVRTHEGEAVMENAVVKP